MAVNLNNAAIFLSYFKPSKCGYWSKLLQYFYNLSTWNCCFDGELSWNSQFLFQTSCNHYCSRGASLCFSLHVADKEVSCLSVEKHLADRLLANTSFGWPQLRHFVIWPKVEFWKVSFYALCVYQMSFGQMPFGQMPFGRMPFGQMPFGQMPIGQMPLDKMPFGQMPFGQMPFGQMPFSQMLFGQMPFGQMPFGQMTWSREKVSTLRMTARSFVKSTPEAKVIKLFCPQFTNFRNKRECLSQTSFSSLV